VFSDPSTRTDFGAWGGVISFDTATSWNFSVGSGPAGSEFDFLSVAIHELAHLLGFGTADSWDNLVTGGEFTGATATALNGGSSPLTNPAADHYAAGTMFGGDEAAMTPSITIGTRKLFTELDFAGLDDIGWQVTPVPEPTSLLAAAGPIIFVAAWVRRRRKG
jgi:hypothetical protein